MSSIAEVILARPEELATFDNLGLPPPEMVSLTLKGVLSMHLAVIEQAETSENWVERLADYQGRPVQNATWEEGPWVFMFPKTLTDILLNQTVANPGLVKRITETDEFSGWDARTVAALLTDLARLAHQSLKENKQIYAWLSL